MSRINSHTSPQTLSLTLIRWLVPVVYAVCIVLMGVNTWEDYQRIRLAEDVAQVVNEAPPTSVAELEGLLSDCLGEMINDYPDADDPSQSYRGFRLEPRVWLTLWAEYETESGKFMDAWLIYAASEKVSLQTPREGLPEPIASTWMAIIAGGIACSGFWLWAARTTTLRNPVQWLAGAVGALPLLVFVPGAIICYLRVTM